MLKRYKKGAKINKYYEYNMYNFSGNCWIIINDNKY